MHDAVDQFQEEGRRALWAKLVHSLAVKALCWKAEGIGLCPSFLGDGCLEAWSPTFWPPSGASWLKGGSMCAACFSSATGGNRMQKYVSTAKTHLFVTYFCPLWCIAGICFKGQTSSRLIGYTSATWVYGDVIEFGSPSALHQEHS